MTGLEFTATTFTEINDRSDNLLASRNVVNIKQMRKINSRSNDQYRVLSPIYGNGEVDQYFALPIAKTTYEEGIFSTIIELPQMRDSDSFEDIEYHQTHLQV